MKLKERATGTEKEAVIERLTKKEVAAFKKSKRFRFNWKGCKDKEVYKIRLKESETIQGLLCLADHPAEGFETLEIELLESAAENVGPQKEWEGVAGCLIAFACREAYKRGYGGSVFLVPKTALIAHYEAAYGFIHVPIKGAGRPHGLMTIEGELAQNLIRKYLE
jgi:hypothetical protein